MLSSVETLEPLKRPHGLDIVPAATVTCALLTTLTVLSTVFAADESVMPALRSLYTGTLYICFRVIRRRSSLPRASPFLLVEIGFLLLTATFVIGAVVRILPVEANPEAVDRTVSALEQGPGFLLGVSLLSYGIVLLIAELLGRQQKLERTYANTRGALESSEHARRTMEHRLLEAEALRAVGELAAGVAHDLRNPLSIVQATVEGLAEQVAASGHQEHFRVIARNLARAEATIQSLLDVGRTGPATPSPTAADELLSDAQDIVLPAAAERGLEVRVALAGVGPLQVDRAAAVRALVNLLTNAVEASVQGGVVVLRGRYRTFAGVARLWVAIEDRGVGVPRHQRSRLFRPFFTTKKRGTGLGLLSARRIVAAMGGDVRLYPRARGGTRALLYLPAAASPRQASLAASGTRR
ncbi:MAG: ATP-binding protein [Planctomycetota bacterium]